MALIHKEPVNAKFFKGDYIVLFAISLEFLQTDFQLPACLFQLLDGKAFSVVVLQLRNAIGDLVNLILDEPLLTLLGDRDLLKLAVADDDGIIIACCDPGTEFLPMSLLKVLFRRNKDVCSRIQTQKLAGPLLCQMIRDNNHALSAQPQTLGLHGSGNHLVGLASANNVGKQGVSAIKNVSNSISLMLAEVDVRCHAAKGYVLAVVFAGSDRIEALVVGLYQVLSSGRIFPYPFTESVPDGLLLLLREGCFFLIQDALFLAVLVLNNVVDTDVAEIERIFEDVIGIGTACAISYIGSNVVRRYGRLSGYVPFCCVGREIDMYATLQIQWRGESLPHELLDIGFVYPGSAQTDINFRRIQVFRLCSLQSRHIGCE